MFKAVHGWYFCLGSSSWVTAAPGTAAPHPHAGGTGGGCRGSEGAPKGRLLVHKVGLVPGARLLQDAESSTSDPNPANGLGFFCFAVAGHEDMGQLRTVSWSLSGAQLRGEKLRQQKQGKATQQINKNQ